MPTFRAEKGTKLTDLDFEGISFAMKKNVVDTGGSPAIAAASTSTAAPKSISYSSVLITSYVQGTTVIVQTSTIVSATPIILTRPTSSSYSASKFE